MLDTTNDIEQIFIKIGSGSDSIIIAAVYMPPRSSIHKYQHFITTVENIIKKHVGAVWICGDFNMPHCTWSTEQYYSIPTSPISTYGEKNLIAEVVTWIHLYQVNSVPNNTGRTLD